MTSQNLKESNTQNKNPIQIKNTLKQQAKSLLLKGCFLMAANKYKQLIEMNLNQYSNRQQAIIYLNCGLCYQFMSEDNKKNYIEALTLMKKSLLLDKTYEKTYYRMLQLLKDQQYYETALNLVPQFIKNDQIDKLLKEIKQCYVNKTNLTKILQGYKSKPFNSKQSSIIIRKLDSNIIQLIQDIDISKPALKQDIRKKLIESNSHIYLLYRLIIQKVMKNHPQKMNVIYSKQQSSLIEQFCFFIKKFFFIRIQNKPPHSMIVIDHSFEAFKQQYLGVVKQYMEIALKGNNIIIFPQNSNFSNSNKFLNKVQRGAMHKSEWQLLKFMRMIDTNFELFTQSFWYLIVNAHKILLKQWVSPLESEVNFNILFVHQFLLSNQICSEQIINLHQKKIFQKQQGSVQNAQFLKYGILNSSYFFNNIDKFEIDMLTKIFNSQAKLIGQIYLKMKGIALLDLHHLLYTLDLLLTIQRNCIEIYQYRKSLTNNSIQKLKYQPIIEKIDTIQNITQLIKIRFEVKHQYNKKNSLQESSLNQRELKLSQQKPKFPKFKLIYSIESIFDYFQSQKDLNFIPIYLIQQIIKYSQKDSYLSNKDRIIQICKTHLSTIQSTLSNQNVPQQLRINKIIYLIIVCIILRIDIKRQIKVNQNIIKEIDINDNELNQIHLECTMFLCLNNIEYVKYYLENSSYITKMLKNFISKSVMSQLEQFSQILNLIYYLICDFQLEQQQFFAKKLGVSQQDIHKARLIQKQTNQKNRQNLLKSKNKFIKIVSQQWIEILNQMCTFVKTVMKMDASCSSKLCKIIYSVAQVNNTRLYSNQIIEFMLESKNLAISNFNFMEICCKFFCVICKKCNPQIFQYKHVQSITDSLLWLIKNSEHQLVIFESLLGLVNLSTIASVRIPAEQIEKCLYEQNSYILHAGISVMNNILIYSEEYNEDTQKNKAFISRLSDILSKYIEFYRDQIPFNENTVSETDYSHPKKIYNSLISLATVLKLNKIQQLESWEKGSRYVKMLNQNESIDLLFKLAIYHSLEKTLPKNWYHNFNNQLGIMQKLQPMKYSKLSQFLM